jgi:hypothetical protein
VGRPITEQPTGRLSVRATGAAHAQVSMWLGCGEGERANRKGSGGGGGSFSASELLAGSCATAPRARLHMYGVLPLFSSSPKIASSPLLLCCLLFHSPQSIRFLVFLWLIAGGDWKLVEVVMFLCSEVLMCPVDL